MLVLSDSVLWAIEITGVALLCLLAVFIFYPASSKWRKNGLPLPPGPKDRWFEPGPK